MYSRSFLRKFLLIIIAGTVIMMIIVYNYDLSKRQKENQKNEIAKIFIDACRMEYKSKYGKEPNNDLYSKISFRAFSRFYDMGKSPINNKIKNIKSGYDEYTYEAKNAMTRSKNNWENLKLKQELGDVCPEAIEKFSD